MGICLTNIPYQSIAHRPGTAASELGPGRRPTIGSAPGIGIKSHYLHHVLLRPGPGSVPIEKNRIALATIDMGIKGGGGMYKTSTTGIFGGMDGNLKKKIKKTSL